MVGKSGARKRRQWPAQANVGAATGVSGARGKLRTVLITGFAAGMLQCNCYVLAERPGTDAVIVDPGQRAMGPLRRILDENRLTPAAVLLTHGHIDHMWSAQKVSDTYGCPTYIHPEDRFMLTDPIYGLGPRMAQLVAGAFFREPRQVVELDRDAALLDLGSVTVNVDHTPGHTRGSVVFRVAGGRRTERSRFHRRHPVRALGGAHRPTWRQRSRPADLDLGQTSGARRRDRGVAGARQRHHHRRGAAFQSIHRRPEPVTEFSAFSGPKGVPDYVPPDSAQFVAVRDGLLGAARRAGYGDIELPIFEDTALFARGVGESTDVVPRRCTRSSTAASARSRCDPRVPPGWCAR